MTSLKPYASDLSDREWAILEHLIPPAKPGGRPRSVDMRQILNGIFYELRSGGAWRLLPHDYPVWSTVYDYFRKWRNAGVWEQIVTTLRERLRVQAGRKATPSGVIIDSQSVKTTERGGPHGYDGGKKLSGRKRHLLVDTMGLLLKVVVHFMDTSHAQPTAQSYKQAMMEQLAVKIGATILDVGCGTGQDALDLVQAVGPHGRVVGIDSSETMLQEARVRAAQTQLPVEYVLADATQLPFADASFDGCLASRVLGHLREPKLAVAEMVRVARPGARVVVADGDMDLIAIDIPDRALARKAIHAACDQMVQGWMGRQMPRLFQQAGLRNIWVEGRLMPLDYAFFQMAFRGVLQRAQAADAILEEELTRFWKALEQAEQERRFFARVDGFVVSGRKPA